MSAVPVSGSWAAGPRAGGTSAGYPPRPAGILPSAGPATAGNTAIPGPFVTILFSRTEMTAGDNCTPDHRAIAGLATTVAPYLRSLGMSATGTLETGLMKPAAPMCTHYGDSLGASWADAENLADNYGWSFGSATATYPWQNLDQLPPAQAWAETCGSARSIDAHGLPGGHGIIAYPGAPKVPVKLQTKYGARCFAWGRLYGDHGTTQASAGTTPPYWQRTGAVNGGSCHVRSRPCYNVTPGTPQGRLPRYILPGRVIRNIEALQPGQWLTFQAYILVTGTNPAYKAKGAGPGYKANRTRWDCRSSNPDLHWTNDNERYCYSDWQRIVNAIAADPNVTVTDPLTVGVAFGRPSNY